jgi:NAD(P)-dependent dehydrogenase (short-subunit alcohol dehydrogenase family)
VRRRGIGRAVALQLARDGAEVVVFSVKAGAAIENIVA